MVDMNSARTPANLWHVSCSHPSGDFIDGMWICAHCWRLLPGRPKIYDMEPVPGCEDGDKRLRQMVSHAPIAEHEGLRLAEFIDMMARRLVAQSTFAMPDARRYAVDILATVGEPFGAPDYDWSVDGAHGIVDDDLSSWGSDGEVGNE